MKKIVLLYMFFLFSFFSCRNCYNYHLEFHVIHDIQTFQDICFSGQPDNVFLALLNTYKDDFTILNDMINNATPTPLTYAAINGNEPMLKKLLPYVNQALPWNHAALYYAAFICRENIVDILLEAGLATRETNCYSYEIHERKITKASTLKNFIKHNENICKNWAHPLTAAINTSKKYRQINKNIFNVLWNASIDKQKAIRSARFTYDTRDDVIHTCIQSGFITKKLIKQRQFITAHGPRYLISLIEQHSHLISFEDEKAFNDKQIQKIKTTIT